MRKNPWEPLGGTPKAKIRERKIAPYAIYTTLLLFDAHFKDKEDTGPFLPYIIVRC